MDKATVVHSYPYESSHVNPANNYINRKCYEFMRWSIQSDSISVWVPILPVHSPYDGILMLVRHGNNSFPRGIQWNRILIGMHLWMVDENDIYIYGMIYTRILERENKGHVRCVYCVIPVALDNELFVRNTLKFKSLLRTSKSQVSTLFGSLLTMMTSWICDGFKSVDWYKLWWLSCIGAPSASSSSLRVL